MQKNSGWQSEQYPDDADIATHTAEAKMDLHPWDLWTHDGKAQPWTAEIVATLERVLAGSPRHPLTAPLYVHAVEASAEPGKADARPTCCAT